MTTGLEYYAKHRDDYAFYLYSQNRSGSRFELEYAIDDNIDYFHQEIEEWNRALHEDVIDIFPFMRVGCSDPPWIR